jgi:hypothetical protein
MAQFTKPIPGKHIALAENKIIPHNRIYNPSLSDQKRSDILIGPLIIHGLDYVNKNQEAFCLLKETAKLYSIQDKNPNNSDLSQALEDNYGDLTETLSHLIYHSGLIA